MSVTREIHITNAYLNILRLQSTPRLTAKDEGASLVSRARMPPMVLLPLIQHALAHRGEVVGGDAQFPIWITASQGKQQGYGVSSECPQILRSNT